MAIELSHLACAECGMDYLVWYADRKMFFCKNCGNLSLEVSHTKRPWLRCNTCTVRCEGCGIVVTVIKENMKYGKVHECKFCRRENNKRLDEGIRLFVSDGS